MKVCPRCGVQNPDQVDICGNCGNFLPPSPSEPAQEKNSPLIPILIAVIAAVVVIATVVIILLVTGKKSPTPPQSVMVADNATPAPTQKEAGKVYSDTGDTYITIVQPTDDGYADEPEEPEDDDDWNNDDNTGDKNDPSDEDDEDDDDEFGPGDKDNYTYDLVTTTWLENSDIRDLTGEQKQYYVNTLFAAYGYRFQNPDLQRYFEYQDWYSPDYAYDPGDQDGIASNFDDIAKHNLKILKS